MSRRTLVNLIFFNAVFAVLLVWAAANIVTLDFLERPYEITGDFEQASGVTPDAEVTYLGVNYGRVGEVERTDDGVRITMKIDRGKEIPAGSIARIWRKSAIGEPYIDFVPPEGYDADEPGRIEPGGHVPVERTTVPLEFSELLRSASEVISSIDPEAAGNVVHELALALDGRSADLRTLTTSMDQLTASFAERTEQLDRLSENSTRITEVMADKRLSVSRSLANLRAVTEALARSEGDLRALLDSGPDFLTVTADLVSDQKQNLDCLLSDLAPVLRAAGAPDNVDALRTTLTNGPTAFGYVASTIDHEPDGPWIRVNMLFPFEGADPRVYVPKRELPAVPTISPCLSELTAAAPATGASTPASSRGATPSADAAETSASGRSATAGADEAGGVRGFLARTGGVVLGGLAALLAVGGALAWYARRRSTTI